MKTLKNVSLALLAVSFMAACSSTRPAGSGGSSGTTGMDSGSSSTTSVTTETSTSGTYNSDATNTYSGAYSNTAYGSGSSSGWTGTGYYTYDPMAERTSMQYFMNGYQGPLDYASFTNFTTAQAFLPLVAEGSGREVELSRIAQERSTNSAVRDFATMIINDHTKSHQELMTLAAATNVTIPATDYSAWRNNPSYGTTVVTTTTTTTSGMPGYAGSGSTMNTTSNNASDPRITPPLANDLRDISGFPPEMENKSIVPDPNNSTTVERLQNNTSGVNPYTGSDPKIAPPLSNNLTDISGFPPEMDNKPIVPDPNNSTTLARLNSNQSNSMNSTTWNSGQAGSSGYANSSTVVTSTGSSRNTGNAANAAAMTTMNEMAALNNLTGAAFDQQYIRMMLQDHYQTIELFKNAALSSDPQVKAFAQKTLPVLQAHYNAALKLQ